MENCLKLAEQPTDSTPCDSSIAELGSDSVTVLSTVLVGAVFFASGVPALVYQMDWQRILALHSGVGIYSVAMIVAAFMGGLGIGHLVGGVMSTRLSGRGALRMFGLIELGIGLFGVVSAPLYYDLLYLKVPWLSETTWRAGLCHFVALLIPTGLMGMSLPVLVRAAVRNVETAGRMIGYLYGVNVLGASLGALVTPWVLIRHWGVRRAILIAVGCNVLAGVSALLVSRFRAFAEPADDRVSGRSTRVGLWRGNPSRRSFLLWVLLYTVSGFNGLALEIVWFRLCDVASKSTAFTFGTVLAVYLAGLGMGSVIGVPLLARLRQPLRAFLICQSLIVGYSALAVVLLALVPSYVPGVDWLMNYWRGYDGVVPGSSSSLSLLTFYVWLPLALFAFPTVLMGIAFCILQRAVQDDRQTSGLKVGVLQTANIVGCVAGSLVVGLQLLSRIGTTGTLRTLLGIGLVFVVLGVRNFGWRSPFIWLGAALVGLMVLMPSQDVLWLRLHGFAPGSTPWAMAEEDATGVVAITPEELGKLRLSVDGKGHSWLPYGSIHSYLGALPAVVHAAPRRVAIIGLGSGDTAWAAACRPETEEVTVFELCAPQQRLLERLATTGQLPQLQQFLRDPRVHIEVADGRNALARSRNRYDLIEADASRPQSGYSGNLYSIEFFSLCAGKLSPGGIMCTWSPTDRVYATFCQVFPHVLELNNGEMLVGSDSPLSPDPAAWEGRIRSREVSTYLGRAISEGLWDYANSARPATPVRGQWLLPNRDLFPRDEFKSPGRKRPTPLLSTDREEPRSDRSWGIGNPLWSELGERS